MRTLVAQVVLMLVASGFAHAKTSKNTCGSAKEAFGIVDCVEATEVLKEIKAGKREFNKLLITGTLTLDRLPPDLINLRFNGSVFDHDPTFGQFVPRGSLEFRETYVHKRHNEKVALPASALVNTILRGDDIRLSGVRMTCSPEISPCEM